MAIDLLTATAADLQAQLTNGAISSRQLVGLYLRQISKYDGYLRAVIATAPESLLMRTASALDQERAQGNVRGPLHGIPILVKDNIMTGPDLGLPTTCGSLALAGSVPRYSADIVERLRDAGAIILGKASMSEWAWFRSDQADSGWCAVRGQTQSAYVRGGFRKDDTCTGHSSPGGSSTGSAVGVAAGFAPLSIGTETIGSLIVPADRAGLYTIKPTLKIIPQSGIIPISPEADSAGPMTKSVADLATLMDVLVDPSATSKPRGGYRSAVTGSWGEIRIGILNPVEWLFSDDMQKPEPAARDQMLREWAAAFQKLRTVAKVVKPVSLLSLKELSASGTKEFWRAFHYTFARDLQECLTQIDNTKVHTLADLIEFNQQHADQELPPNVPDQNGLLQALNCSMSQAEYQNIINWNRNMARIQGIDKTLTDYGVDIIMAPGDGQLWTMVASAGYPVASMPLGYLDFNGRPFGVQITAGAHQDALLIQAQSAWEATLPKRQPPNLDEVVKCPAPVRDGSSRRR